MVLRLSTHARRVMCSRTGIGHWFATQDSGVVIYLYVQVIVRLTMKNLLPQGSYSVWNTWKSMEFNFPFSRSWIEWNSELCYGTVWTFGSFVEIFLGLSLTFVCLYIFHAIWRKVLRNFVEIDWNLILKSQKYLYFHFVTLFNAVCLQICISDVYFGMEFYILWY